MSGIIVDNLGRSSGLMKQSSAGTIDWQTSDIKTGNFTAVAGEGYFVNTSSSAITVSLPAGSAGSIIGLVDYAGTWDSNACVLDSNGSEKIQGSTADAALADDRGAVEIIYVDSTQGWVITTSNDATIKSPYVVASGGTETTDGDYKVHTFTGDGTFTVSSAGNAAGSTTVDYLIVAAGGGGGKHQAGGGGAGGLRKNYPNQATGGTSISVSPGSYSIVVGGGGAGQTSGTSNAQGADGDDSSAFSVTSSGGGGGGSYDTG